MNVATFDSRAARAQWRNILDTAGEGNGDIVITRHGKPVVTVIDYEDWLALQDELDDLRAARRADVLIEEYLRDPSTARPWAEFRQELVAEGLLDAAG
jgi:prevent-host-death family protein